MTTDTHPISEIPLGALVAERPARARLFEGLHLDYCCGGSHTLCGGSHTLAEACAARGLDLDAVLAALDALDTAAVSTGAYESTDWRRASIGELLDHIVAVHHDGLREAFPRIEGLLGRVVRAHGAREPRLREVQRRFVEIRRQLEPHLASEERDLFPACRAWERAAAPVDERLLAEHEDEHEAVGGALAVLRALCHDFDRDAALCGTHRALLDALETFERDLHQHVHEENNILMLRVRDTPPVPRARTHFGPPPDGAGAPASASSESLPDCCRAWVAEQAHGWAAKRRRGERYQS